MSLEPQFRIRDELYPIPQNERLGELRLIERVTGITHRAFRGRAIDQQQRIAGLDDNGDADLTPQQVLAVLDDIVTVGRIAQAIQRAHPAWSTERVAAFVDELDEDEVIMEGGGDDEDEDEIPPPNGEPDGPSSSPSGTDSAPGSSSDSGTASSESATPPSSGQSTSPTSPEARSDPET